MRKERPQFVLTIGLFGSLVFHGAILVPLFVGLMAGAGPAQMAPSDLDHELLRPPESPPPPEVDLGLESSTASTLTWIGYDEYLEQIAERADFEQAAFTMADAADPGLPAPAPVVPAAPPAPPTQEQTEVPEATAAESSQPSVTPAGLMAAINELIALAAPTDRPEPSDEAPSLAPDEPTTEPPTTEPPVPDPPAPKEDPAPAEPADPSPPPAAPPGTETPVTEPPTETPGSPKSDPGDPSDRESPATSTITLDELKRGKPLARGGLELRPQKPVFTTLTLLTAAPRNPTVRITFGKNGVPTQAVIVADSGDQRVDHAIESSLYRWRATGAALDELEEGGTVDIELKIILNPRA